MTKIRVIIFHDVLCAWCFIGSKNLKEAIEPYGDRIERTFVSWLLYPHDFQKAGDRVKKSILNHWEEARMQPGGEKIDPEAIREKKFPFPYSTPAMAAVKCAEKQGGPEMHQKFYDLLQEALYFRGENVNDPELLAGYAGQTNLDVNLFSADFDSGLYHNMVVQEYEQSKEAGIEAIPATIIGHELIMGAVPPEEFKASIERQIEAHKGAA